MDQGFWREKWRSGQLGWHRDTPNPMLLKHFSALGLAPGARVFVPLCGKTVDIGWLLGNGFRVAGAELVESAIEELFAELGIEPAVSTVGSLKHYGGEGIDIFVGDLFDLDAETLGPVTAVYDRAALVALPPDMRPRYADHLAGVTTHAPQLLITFDYEPSIMEGPPFSVTEEEVRALYARSFRVELLESADVEGGLKGFCPATERVWTLRRSR